MPVDPYNLFSGYNSASSYNPVDRSTIKTAIKPYGLKFSDRKSFRGAAPQDLRKLATHLVLKRYYQMKRGKGNTLAGSTAQSLLRQYLGGDAGRTTESLQLGGLSGDSFRTPLPGGRFRRYR